MEQSQAVIYEDPLISYDPLLLDDPMVPRVTNRRVFPFQGYMVRQINFTRVHHLSLGLSTVFIITCHAFQAHSESFPWERIRHIVVFFF